MAPHFHLVSLGCPKNLVDSEVAYGLLESSGWAGVDTPEQADVLLINTCGFIQAAKEESVESLLDMGTLKSESGVKRLYATGCLSQRYGQGKVVAVFTDSLWKWKLHPQAYRSKPYQRFFNRDLGNMCQIYDFSNGQGMDVYRGISPRDFREQPFVVVYFQAWIQTALHQDFT